MRKVIYCLLFSIICLSSTAQTTVRNYSFEYFDCFNHPIGWRPQISTPNAYSIMVRNDEAFDGNCYISIKSNPDAISTKSTGLFNTILSRDKINNKDSIKVIAYIKTNDVKDGVASIWMQMNGQGSIIRDVNFDKHGISGTTGWTKAEISLPITPDVLSIAFGCKFTGKGEALFDSFQVFIDNVELK